MEILLTIGKRIRTMRKEKGISQEALADRSGIDRTYMTSVEQGKRNISVLILEKIAKGLEVDIKELL